MEKRKRFFICVLTGILACSSCLTASADSAIDAGKLKSGLLLNERNNYQYNIFDYNTNNDQSVNVLDLCRSKAYVLEKNKKTTQSINISCLRPWVTSDGSIITIPVNIKGNTEGVSSLSFYIEYNNWYFLILQLMTMFSLLHMTEKMLQRSAILFTWYSVLFRMYHIQPMSLIFLIYRVLYSALTEIRENFQMKNTIRILPDSNIHSQEETADLM